MQVKENQTEVLFVRHTQRRPPNRSFSWNFPLSDKKHRKKRILKQKLLPKFESRAVCLIKMLKK